MSTLELSFWIGGLIICSAVLLRACLMAVDGLLQYRHTQAQRTREAEMWDLRIAAVRKVVDAQAVQEGTWTGWRSFQVRRKVKEDAIDGICSFYLYPHDGKAIATYRPGQFLTIQVRTPGKASPDVRCYSLSDSPKRDHYRLTIKRIVSPPGDASVPPGRVSNYLHDHIHENDIIDVRAPSGSFFLDMSKETPVVLIGGGVGVTPALAMLNAICESGSARETWFFYGVRNRAEHIMADHLRKIAAEHPNVHLQVCYSRPSDKCTPGIDYHHKSHVNVELLKRVLPSSNYHFYMCGPGPMMDGLVQGLEDWGVPAECVHLELFGPSAASKGPAKIDLKPEGTVTGPTVKFHKSGKIVSWDSQVSHLWQLAKLAGVEIDSGCLQGNCGTCQVAIISGEVEYPQKPAFDPQQGTCLVCCSVPKTSLELNA